jgi:hypothetical protein
MKGDQMSGDKLRATAFKTETGGAARGQQHADARPLESAPETERPGAAAAASTTRRTVGVYERPAQRARLSLPLVVILILSALVSVVTAVRFLF